MNKPLVSVIIPAYNHEMYVEETINSIIAQTYENIELIVVDDGSKDSTWQKICAMRERCDARFKRVVFETQVNQGCCTTLNKLISLAQGEFLYLIASDDVSVPVAIEKQATFLAENPDYVLAVGDNGFVDENSVRRGWIKSRQLCDLETAPYKTMVQYNSRKTDIFFTEEFGSYESIVRNNYLTNGYLIRTSAVRKFGGFTKEAPLEDWYLQLQLSKLGKYKYIDEVLFLYRCHSNNTATKKDYMTGIIQKTLDYEEKIVSRPGNEKWKKLFDENIIKKRYRIKLSSKFCWYRESKVFRRREIVVLFGKQFVISEKSYS